MPRKCSFCVLDVKPLKIEPVGNIPCKQTNLRRAGFGSSLTSLRKIILFCQPNHDRGDKW